MDIKDPARKGTLRWALSEFAYQRTCIKGGKPFPLLPQLVYYEMLIHKELGEYEKAQMKMMELKKYGGTKN